MPPPRVAAAAAVLLALLLAYTECSQTKEKEDFFVTAVVPGSDGEWVAETLRGLIEGRLRQYDVSTRAVPPPRACYTEPLSWNCQNAVLHQLTHGNLVAAVLPLPIALGQFPNNWQLRDYGIVDVGDATEQPLRFQCVAAPPARSLLDLANSDMALHYPPPPLSTPVGACPVAACAALLFADRSEANRTSAALERHQLAAQVYLLDKQAMNFSKTGASIVCDFAPELGLKLKDTYRNLGPLPCETTECPFESRRLAKLVNTRALLDTLRAILVMEHFKLDIRNLRELCDHAKQSGIDNAVSDWLKANPDRVHLQEIRAVALVPDVAWLDDTYRRSSLANAAALAESKAPSNANVIFKVEVQYERSPEDAAAYLERQLNTRFGQMTALAGPAGSAAWRLAADKAAAHALPLLAYSAQGGGGGGGGGAGGGAALLAAGTAAERAAALGAWAAARGWRRLALLAPPDHARAAAPALRAHLAVQVALDDSTSALDLDLIEEWAKSAAAADARILYVWSEDVRVVAAAVCAASRHQLTAARGAVWLLPPLAAAALAAAAPPAAAASPAAPAAPAAAPAAPSAAPAAAPAAACAVAPLLDGHFTVAPAWQAAWEGWDTPAALPPPSLPNIQEHWNELCKRNGDVCVWPPPAPAALLYDLLSLWIRAVDRVITAEPNAWDNLHKTDIIMKIIGNATEQEFTGLTGKFEWRVDKQNVWARISPIVIAQWDGANATWRQVAAWNGSALQQRAGVLRWRTADGRAPGDGGDGDRCVLRGVARALRVSCGAAWALAALLLAGGAAALLAAAALRWRRRAERSFRRRLAALGLHALPPAAADRWEVPRERVVINRKLGTGAFGTVYGGHALLGERGWSAVAVKTLKPGASTEEKLDFLAEAEAMKRLDHKNVVRLLGVVTKTEPVCTVMEFMLYGDLKTYLLARRHVADECEVGARRLTAMALDAARALSYLAEQRWVHRDVAARNCLVSARRVLKLADFGMARRVYDGDYYRLRRRGMLPVRWMAPEALAAGEFSAASDVWALGVLLYEMATLGALPFAGLSNAAVLARVRGGGALQPPPGAAPALAALLRACWAAAPGARPAAAAVAALLADAPRLVAPCCAPPLDALPLAHAHHANSLWRTHDTPGSAATDTTYLSDARDSDRFLPDDSPL